MSDNNDQGAMNQVFQMYMQGQFKNNNNMPHNQGANQQQQMPMGNQQ